MCQANLSREYQIPVPWLLHAGSRRLQLLGMHTEGILKLADSAGLAVWKTVICS